MTARQMANGMTTTMRWSARMIGLFAVGLFGLFLIESGARIVPALSWSDLQGMPLFLALTVAVAGVLIAWKQEAIGGLMSFTGGALILALAYLASGTGMTFTAFLLAAPLLSAGLLHLACSLGTRLSALHLDRAPQAIRSGRWALSSTAQAR